MPKRPSRRWMKRCIKGVEESGRAKDAGAVCGNTWYHKMSESDRQKEIRKEKRHKR